MGHFEQLLAER